MGDPYPSAAGAVAELSSAFLFLGVGEALFLPLSVWLSSALNGRIGLNAKKRRGSYALGYGGQQVHEEVNYVFVSDCHPFSVILLDYGHRKACSIPTDASYFIVQADIKNE